MGYTTKYTGELLFGHEVTLDEIRLLRKLLNKDVRELSPEVVGPTVPAFYHIDFKLNAEMTGLKWNGAEKSDDLSVVANWLSDRLRRTNPKFKLTGELKAQGDDRKDKWTLRMIDGKANHIDDPRNPREVECPECGHEFVP